MPKTINATDYIVTRCANCGMLNVVPRESADGRTCEKCLGGPLIPIGCAILQQKPVDKITIQVDVERKQLDRLLDDVAAVNENVAGIIQRLEKIRGEQI